jgi:glycosidase
MDRCWKPLMLGTTGAAGFVPNHTSDQHPWFRQSRAGREDPRRDWYIWRDPGPDGAPPNNWIGYFGAPAWEWDPATRQYYLHSFLKEQPDLNWRNPQVRQAMELFPRIDALLKPQTPDLAVAPK